MHGTIIDLAAPATETAVLTIISATGVAFMLAAAVTAIISR